MYSLELDSPELDIFMGDNDDEDNDFEEDFLLEAPYGARTCESNDIYTADYSDQILGVPDLNVEMEDVSYDEESSDSEMSTNSESSSAVVHNIEEMVLCFLRQLAFPGQQKIEGESSEKSEPVNKALSRADHKIEIHLADRKKFGVNGVPAMKCIRFPKKNLSGSSKPFAQLFKVLDLAHEAKLSQVPATKRDIYYKDVSLFKSQKAVDGLVDDLAATFQVERSDLNIRSSPKGLICGSGLTITLFSGESVRCNDSEGTLIPAGEDIKTFSVNEDVAWVLVVEKEAVFQTLCRLEVSKNKYFPGPGIIITGKGYPDVATRHIVKSLADALPRSIPIMAMVDGDPFGIDILSVYKYGSKGMGHENEKLVTRRIKWLGLWASELEGLGVSKDRLLPINKHDEKKALSMLGRENIPGRWRKELQHMLHSRHKAEIEILSSYKNKASDMLKEAESGYGEANSVGSLADRDQDSAARGSQCAPHALILRYLEFKITEFVVSARQRTGGRKLEW